MMEGGIEGTVSHILSSEQAEPRIPLMQSGGLWPR